MKRVGTLLKALPKLLNKSSGTFSFWLDERRVIIDAERRLQSKPSVEPYIDAHINKEQRARDILFAPDTASGRFLEIGSGDGKLTYLLGIKGNFDWDDTFYSQNKALFDAKFSYTGLDLVANPAQSILGGDICRDDFIESLASEKRSFDVVYSNNVFEHLRKPWIAARNVYELLKPGGVCITVVPFSQRYHESPGDYFRYTHEGMRALFEDAGSLEVLASGYDILGRRNDWQGSGKANDAIPVDDFGAWRETWFTFFAFRKTGI